VCDSWVIAQHVACDVVECLGLAGLGERKEDGPAAFLVEGGNDLVGGGDLVGVSHDLFNLNFLFNLDWSFLENRGFLDWGGSSGGSSSTLLSNWNVFAVLALALGVPIGKSTRLDVFATG